MSTENEQEWPIGWKQVKAAIRGLS